ncbi:unnamed protein product [Peronospora destructor]|uniref:Inositol-3,4-bisphosphate 4-phosphatase n=1 Tax=Peronospora destructor TaxID=86335 RepID=A0AAV0UNL3_9STRA|nr:unnamed protein product [Peronospora destructor]
MNNNREISLGRYMESVVVCHAVNTVDERLRTIRRGTQGSDWSCTDECCNGLVLDSNVWHGIENVYPGQTNGTFGVRVTPTDFLDVFYPEGMAGEIYTVHQIMLASPPGYNFTEGCSCYLERLPNSSAMLQRQSTNCQVSTFFGGSKTYLTVDITEEYRTNDTFMFVFDGVVTPTGINDSDGFMTNVTYTTDTNLTPVYFVYNDSENTAFGTYVRVTDLMSATLSSGMFLPENVYPGNSGNASLTFYTDANIPEGSSVTVKFGSKWGFVSDAVWSWEVHPLVTSISKSFFALATVATAATAEKVDEKTNRLSLVSYSSLDNSWTFVVEEPILIGWVSLSVDRVKNPSVAFSGLDAIFIEIRNPQDLFIIGGTFSAVLVYLTLGATASPYNYVTMVVLVGSLVFCCVAIRKNGLSFSLGSIWTDITAICTVLALATVIVNNFIWFLTRGSTYFYIMHVYLCFTFTMLTAVCFHWGTVLSLRLRKLPKLTASVAFAVLNVLFYAFQIGYLLNNQALISRVYDSENDITTLAYQQCHENTDMSPTVFSEIQGYLWACYAEDDDDFFLVSTSVTYGIFLVLTFVVMALGVMVMRRGKLLLGNASGPHQIVLIKALRLYYALIGIVTLVYLLSWIVQLISRTTRGIAYPWFYIFTVWLPCSIPPCCIISLQWNATAQSLREADREASGDCSPLSESGYGEIRTPSLVFSTADRWTEGSLEKVEEFMAEEATVDAGSSKRFLMNSAILPTDDYVGLSMALEMNEDFTHGCFIAIQRSEVKDGRDSASSTWRQISNTDTVMASVKDLASIVLPHQQRYLYTFLSVPRIPVGAAAEKIRMVVYALNSGPASSLNHADHSEMTATEVLAAMERTQSSHGFDDDGDSQHALDSSLLETEALSGFQSSRVIDELFEMESPGSVDDVDSRESRSDLNSGFSMVPHSLRVVVEFTVSTGVLATAGARTEQTILTATEDSYKRFGLSTAPPKLLVNTVIPKTAGARYGFNGVEDGLRPAASAISKQYHIREQGLLVVEDLTESRFSNWIPRQILEILIRYRTKELLVAENDLARLEAYDRQRQKGSDRGIYENLIQQIQDDGDLNHCREWMLHRCHERKEYVELLCQLRRVYVLRDQRKMYFKASTDKKNAQLRFLPINLHLQEMWVGNADTVAQNSLGSSGISDINTSAAAAVYDIVTVGAMAAHVYKFKNGGIFGMEEQHAKLRPRVRETQGSTATYRQTPLWSESEQKADDMEWVLGKRMDVCFPQAVAALVTAFTRKVDLALQHAQPEQGQAMLEQLSQLGFLFNVESLVSTHGNEAGMLEDMAGAVNELRNVRFVLVKEQDEISEMDAEGSGNKSPQPVSYHLEEESKRNPSSSSLSKLSSSSHDAAGSDGGEKHLLDPQVTQRQSMHLESAVSSNSTNSTNSTGIGGVVDVDVFTSINDALSETSSGNTRGSESSGGRPSSREEQPMSSQSSSFSGVGQRLLSTFIKARNHRLLGARPGGNWDNVQSLASASVDKLFPFTHLVIRIKLRSGKVKLTKALRHGGSIKVCPVLFTQGINEKQTLANNTGSSVTRLQDIINATSLRTLRNYCDRYCKYTSMRQIQASQQQQRQRDHSTRPQPPSSPNAVVTPSGPSCEEVYRILGELDKLIGAAGRQARKKRPEILQLSSDLCRYISGGRVTVCKSAKDRTGMSVTLEQGRILVQHHGLREHKKASIVSVMRSEGVRIENALKNTGRRVFAFNALQRSLLPEEYRCPPRTSGRNVS